MQRYKSGNGGGVANPSPPSAPGTLTLYNSDTQVAVTPGAIVKVRVGPARPFSVNPLPSGLQKSPQ